ncbi:hypothetical protein DUNSADRAFT_6143 [Dunaliella salina]|uniref:Uncharacterized protein n=1 Tax=Dunaliella salina TaxID=3046 RepID=A0ABQ7GP01_DUNSA|nr:hypothetical protein DUNSADRAFT_6143 [Dunaliella salina]|eukprot:KAF5836313.1 hypothetical protein DUNSADRAFT_6143 [Dunaliella salina]
MFAPDGRPAGAALAYEGCGNQRRGRADAFNKILFQQLARTNPIKLEHLLQSVVGRGAPAAEENGVAGMEDS